MDGTIPFPCPSAAARRRWERQKSRRTAIVPGSSRILRYGNAYPPEWPPVPKQPPRSHCRWQKSYLPESPGGPESYNSFSPILSDIREEPSHSPDYLRRHTENAALEPLMPVVLSLLTVPWEAARRRDR